MNKIKDIYFKDLEKSQMVDLLNDQLPIKVKINLELINRIQKRCPHIDKVEIGLIVKTTFQSIRELLVLGKTINVKSLFNNLHFYFYPHLRKNKTLIRMKVKVSTPPNLKKCDD